jgi:hypothetical protein
MNYDAGFRLKNIYKNIDGAASDQLIDSMQYNELGQLRFKYLGNSLDNLFYDYNIRDWVTGINKNYVTRTAFHYFGMELAYDNPFSALSILPNYAHPSFNGNIAGTVWRSAGDDIYRKYDFAYDNVNRLTGAAYVDNRINGWGKTATDYSVCHIRYHQLPGDGDRISGWPVAWLGGYPNGRDEPAAKRSDQLFDCE